MHFTEGKNSHAKHIYKVYVFVTMIIFLKGFGSKVLDLGSYSA